MLTAKQLRSALKDVPDDCPVYIEGKIPADFAAYYDKKLYIELVRRNF